MTYDSFVLVFKTLYYFLFFIFLDFLPLKCDACKQDFCKDHFTYAAHKCPLAFTKVIDHTSFQRF